MKNLNLSLYAFHLCQSLDDAPDTHSKDAGLLWESLRGLAAKLPFPELKKFTEPTEANPETSLDFQAIEINHISLTGNLSTFKIHDTYSVDLTLSFQDEQAHFFPGNVVIFQPQALIDVTANLGKVLWLTGESEDLNERQLARATQWAEQLCQQATYIKEDHLFNCPLFIFAADSVTILISLAEPNAIDLERAQENYYNLRNLFWTYQKIVVVEKLAKEGYQGARKLYSELEAQVQEFNQVFSQTPEKRLQKLDELLQTIPQRLLDYNCKLRDLKAHYTTIDANWKNFKVSLSHILDESAGDKLSYWSDFATKTAPLYLKQIKTYIDYLEPGQVLFSDLINSIRATAEIEQVKSDRIWQQEEKEREKRLQISRDAAQQQSEQLQDQIQAVGVGIAAGAIVASTSGLMTQPWYLPNGQKIEVTLIPHPLWIGLFFSVVCSLGAWWIAQNVIKKRRLSTIILKNHPVWQNLSELVNRLDANSLALAHLESCDYQISGYSDECDRVYPKITLPRPLSPQLISSGVILNGDKRCIQLKFTLNLETATPPISIAQLMLVYDENLEFIDENWQIDLNSELIQIQG